MTQGQAADSARLPSWWERWPGRIEWELDCFARRSLPIEVLEDPREGAHRLVVESSVNVEDEPVRVRVVYPDSYPHRPFALYAPDLLLPRHQAPNGNLCVFPRGSDQWRPDCNAADSVADDVPHLIHLVREGGDRLRDHEVPQGEPLSVYYNSTAQGCIVIDERATADFTPRSGDAGDLVVGLNSDPQWMLGRHDDGTSPEEEAQRPVLGQGYLRNLHADGVARLAEPSAHLNERYPSELHGRWVHLDNPPFTHSPEDVWAACLAADPATESFVNRTQKAQLIGVCFAEEIQQGVYGTGWTFLYRYVTETPIKPKGKRGGRSGNPAAPRVHRTATTPRFVKALRWTDASLSIRIPELAPLRAKTIALVGLGSLGAPVALELGKERIHTLRVLDGDYMDPGTSVRHPLGLNWAGVSKSIAVGYAVIGHNPEVKVETTVLNIGHHALETDGDAAAEQQAMLSLLNGADLIISAAAEHDVNRYLDDIASNLNIPRLHLWGLSGYGGIVALLDQTTGCYHCLSGFLSEKAQAGQPLVAVPPDAVDTIQGPGCADQTFTANHADLQPISNQAVRLANGYLCGPEGGYPRFQHDVFAVQVREPDGTPIPPRWSVHKLPPTAGCPTCPAG